MSKKRLRKVAILLAVVLLFSGWQVPMKLSASTGVTVNTQAEFMAALNKNQSPIVVNGAITLGEESDSTGKMLPVVIPAGTVIQGTAGASLDCRGPIQLAGDGVVIKDIEMLFSSSDALGSVPHREIFLAGHSLTLDNVETYLEGAGGSLGGFGGSEEELLPSVYAGGFEGTEVGQAASLTILKATSKTMFQGIYLSHDAGTDDKVPYVGVATLKLCPKVTIRDGVVADTSGDASIEVSGQGYLSGLKVYGNENTTLAVAETDLNSTVLYQVENLELSENAYLELQQGTLVNVAIDQGACLDLNKVPGMVVQGDFVGTESEDGQGVLVLDKEGSLLIQGAVSGTTVLQTENRNFPGVFISDKRYVTAFDVPYDVTGFLVPESLIESYEMYYETDGWYVYTIYQDDFPVVGSVDIVYAPTAVDVSKIKSNAEPAENAPYCEVIWRDEAGNAFSASTVEYMGLYFYDTVIGVKTEYWQDVNASEQTDWGNVVQFRTNEDAPGQYFFYVYEDDIVKTGEYTFLFLDSYCEETLDTVADIRALQDRIKAEMTVMLYDSTENAGETTDISGEDILVEAIEEQIYTGKMVQPEIALTKDGEPLKEGVDYCVTYEDNIAVGNAKAIIVGMGDYCGTREVTFSIIKAEPQITLTVSSDSALEYEQELTLELQIFPYNEDAVASVSFYCGDELLGSANVSDRGKAKLTYQTTERKIPTGESSIRAEFGGTANLESRTAELEIDLQKKTIAEIASITLQDFESDGSIKTTEILSVTDANDVTYAAAGTAELAAGTLGSYEEAKILNWTLTGVRADWYQLPEAVEQITVSPAVMVTRATEDIGGEGIVVEEIPDQSYTSEQIKPILKITKGQDVLEEGVDYQVSYENNIAIGTDTARAVVTGIGAYHGTRTETFSIIKATPVMTVTVNGEVETTVAYEDLVTLTAQLSPYYAEDGAEAESVSFYCGTILLGTAEVGTNGLATLEYDTTEQKLAVAVHRIRAEYAGSELLEQASEAANLTLEKKTLQAGEIASVTLQDFVSDGSVKNTAILSVTDAEGVTYAATGTAELESGTAGSYEEAKVLSWALTGDDAEWYQLPEAVEQITVSPAVMVTRATEDISGEGIVIEEIPDQSYTGEQIKPILKITKGQDVLEEGVDYQVSYENNIAIGTDTARAVVTGIGAYHGTRTETFSIIKATPNLTLTVNGEQKTTVAYEDEVVLIAQLESYYADATEDADTVVFYCGDVLLGTAEVGANGQAILQYQTIDQKVTVGTHSIRVEYAGSDVLEEADAEGSLTLEKKTLQAEKIVSITLQDFESDGSVKTTVILSVTDTNDVTYEATGTAELASGAAGSYEVAKVLSWSLTGVLAEWYQLPEAVEQITVSPAVTITAVQKPEPDPEPIENPFGDVMDSDWFKPFVMFAYEHGLMGGKGEMPDGTLKFDPANTITRAEFVQMLYAKENYPDVEYVDTFTDVADELWYTDAILWAAREEIVGGKKADFFDVNGKITRQEIALILYKYALYKEYDVNETENADLTGFADAASVSTWADTGMKWAVEYNVIGGKNVNGETMLSPGGNAIRAEAATMMKAFMTAYEEVE